jgi:hypothetical protein
MLIAAAAVVVVAMMVMMMHLHEGIIGCRTEHSAQRVIRYVSDGLQPL